MTPFKTTRGKHDDETEGDGFGCSLFLVLGNSLEEILPEAVGNLVCPDF